MDKKILAVVAGLLLVGIAYLASAQSVTLSNSTPIRIDLGQNVILTNTTSGVISPYNWSYHFSNSVWAFTPGNNIFSFTRAGVYNISLSVSYLNANVENTIMSNNMTINVSRDPGVAISPINTSAVAGVRETLQANITGGTSPYTYNWFNASTCTGTANGTAATYRTAIINSTSYFCLRVQDIRGFNAITSGYLTPAPVIYTPGGAELQSGGLLIEVSPTITTNSMGTTVYNITDGVIFNLSVCGQTRTILATALTPTYLSLLTPFYVYNEILPNTPEEFLGVSGCTIRLENLSWMPMLHTAEVLITQGANIPTTTSTATTTSTTSTISNIQIFNAIVITTPTTTRKTTSVKTTSIYTTTKKTSSTTALYHPIIGNTMGSNVPVSNKAISQGEIELAIGGVIIIVAILGGVYFLFFGRGGRGEEAPPREKKKERKPQEFEPSSEEFSSEEGYE